MRPAPATVATLLALAGLVAPAAALAPATAAGPVATAVLVSASARTPDPDISAWPPAGTERSERARAGLTADEVPAAASGNLVTVPGSAEAPRPAQGVRTVRVQFEEGLPVDGTAFAQLVMDVLNDERGWGHDGSVAFARTDGEAEISVVLASGATTDQLCVPLRTMGEYSCGRNGRAVLNAERWSSGAESFLAAGADLTDYREYLVNHEVGHLLGRPHVTCPAPGTVAPVMVQQSIDLGGCLPNGWDALAG
ncbi:DUF3152 domain-containing protein [Georgenia muralis]|uniref:Uncharacterized protein DUF3152 n=1 Tax=Georgenia muralis TaxID=154117 RepID=A0A3N5A7I6_9MICO|nr:DUF3152 domain-containing protein [Georgenia muralis]RPF27661.1 uncharacterized protein DUF3152 [Georgenia muralis]